MSELRCKLLIVGGGPGGYVAAIRAALLGGWMNVLVTDVATARALLDES